jgi:hypothetical protein
MDSEAIVSSKCSKNYKTTQNCYDKAAATCHKCEVEARAAERRRQRDYELEEERPAKQEAYARRLAEVEDEIKQENRLLRDRKEEIDGPNAKT